MINVIVTYQNEDITSIKASGHALFEEYGKDIVCAAVSSVLTGLLNAIDLKTDYECWIDSQSMNIKTNEVSQVGQIICETGLIQLQTIQEQYPNYITIQEVKQ